MPKLRTLLPIALFFVFQIMLNFWVDDMFRNDMDRDISFMEQRMAEDQLSDNQRQLMVATMKDIKWNVSSYVRTASLLVMGINMMILVAVVINRDLDRKHL